MKGNFELVKAESSAAATYSQRMLIFRAALLQSFVLLFAVRYRELIVWLMGSVCPRKQNNYILVH